MQEYNGSSYVWTEGGVIAGVFPDFASFLDYIQNTPRHPSSGIQSERDSLHNADWYGGTSSFADACRIAIEGCPDIEARMVAFQETLPEPPPSFEDYRKKIHDIDGERLNEARYLAGEAECLIRTKKARRQGGRIIRIRVNFGTSGSTGADQIVTKGAAILALCDYLEATGYRVEITICDDAGCDRNMGYSREYLIIPIKNAGDMIDLSRLAFTLAHPAMLRRLGFRWQETLPGFSEGYGRNSDPAECRADCDLYLASGYDSGHFSTDEKAKKWIVETLRKLTDTPKPE